MSMDNIEDKIYFKQLRDELEGAMAKANTLREREVLKLHYGWNIEPIKIKDKNGLKWMMHKWKNS